MEKFLKNQQIPLTQVIDPSTGQAYYAPQNVVYNDKVDSGPTYLRDVIVDQANTASYFSGSITNAISASYALTASYVAGSIASASYALSASYAATASYAQNIIISGSINNVDYIDFNTSASTPAWRNGRIFWDNTDGALSVYNAEQDVTLNVGQENWTRVSNRTGTTITNGTVVRLIGAHGDVPEVERAQSLLVSGSVNVLNQILGVATHDIEDNSKGFITTQGLVRGLNTNAFNDGDTLFVGTGSAGVLQNTPPIAPYEIIPVGVCVKASPGTSGIIYVAVQEPIDFSDLSSVLVQGTYSYGDLWTYVKSGSVGVWTHTNQLSGSYSITGSLRATSFTGSLLGTSSFARTASFVNPLTQSVAITGSLTVNGNNITTGTTTLGNGTFTKAGFATGDILLDNNGTDTPGVLFYYANNSNYGIDSWNGSFDVLSGQLIRTTNKLNETGGAVKMALDTSGNAVFTGFVKANAWRAGQVINDIVLSNTEVTITTTTIATSTSDTDFLRYDYTPISSTSYLVIHYHLASYDFTAGTGNDSYFSRIKVNGTEIVFGAQSTVNGFRTGVLFPLTGRYTNSSTDAKTIVVAARRNSADDSITIVNSSTSMWLRITEIGR
jgi:hypothetical protein